MAQAFSLSARANQWEGFSMSSRQSIKQGVIALLIAAAFLAIAYSQLTEEQEVFLASGLTAGSLMTVCVMIEEGMLSREDVRLYAIGYLASIRKSETGAGLAGAMMGLEKIKNKHPQCPLPD